MLCTAIACMESRLLSMHGASFQKQEIPLEMKKPVISSKLAELAPPDVFCTATYDKYCHHSNSCFQVPNEASPGVVGVTTPLPKPTPPKVPWLQLTSFLMLHCGWYWFFS